MNVREEIVKIINEALNENDLKNIFERLNDCFTVVKYTDNKDLVFLGFLLWSLKQLEIKNIEKLKQCLKDVKERIIFEDYSEALVILKHYIVEEVKK